MRIATRLVESIFMESVLYHVTYTDKVSAIREKGLLPRQTSNWVKTGDKSRYGGGDVFAFENKEDAIRWAGKMDWAFNKGMGTGKISVIEFTADPKDKWRKDTADPISQAGAKGSWLRKPGMVPPGQITGAFPVTTTEIRALVKGAS